jgi:class 3 adenylate cyclase/tetratricopeptide (TPR) repeat protein
MKDPLLLARFVSGLELAMAKSEGGGPRQCTFEAATLYADFSGFTAQTERLAKDGPAGAEVLSEVLNWHFGQLTDGVVRAGGDVLYFTGDGLIAVFSDPSKVRAARRAAAAALSIQGALLSGAPPHSIRFRLRTSLGSGRIRVQRVGGHDRRWLSLVGGSAVDTALATDAQAAPGMVATSDATWQLLATHAEGGLRDGAAVMEVRALRLQDGDQIDPLIPLIGEDDVRASSDIVLPILRERLVDIEAGVLSEFRDVSAMFVALPGLDPGRQGDLEPLHRATLIVQKETRRLDGSLYQMQREDKGCVIVLAWGLPGQAHDDDPARAAQASVIITRRLMKAGITCRAGVATGTAFCGACGGLTRLNYSIIGSTMNRAARLMAKAQQDPLVDEATARGGQRWMTFAARPSLNLKGFASPVAVFAPGIRRIGRGEPVDRQSLIGRAEELAAIERRLNDFRHGKGGGSMILVAEAGMGKSTLLRIGIAHANAMGLRILEGGADSIEQSTAFLGLRSAIETLIGLTPGFDPVQARKAVSKRLAALPARLGELAPLLNAVLPLDFPDNALTRQLSGTLRATNLADLLVALVGQAAEEAPQVLALEDLHWMDSASLQICARLIGSIPRLLLLATMRPVTPMDPSLEPLVKGAGSSRLVLDSMPDEGIIELTRRRLRAHTIPVALKALILAKAEGNPFYSEEFALALVDSGAVEVLDGKCLLAKDFDLSALNLPGNVKSVITCRVDRLPGESHHLLKVASVLGRSFDIPSLCALLPPAVDSRAMRVDLDALISHELLIAEAKDESRFVFRHALIQEATYNLLPFAQRRLLHSSAAHHLERTHADDKNAYSARLAYHWSRAERPDLALPYLGIAGRQSLESWANQDAVEFFREALKIDLAMRGPLAFDSRRAEWHVQLAEAHYSLIQWEEARRHYVEAIRLSGFPAPQFGWRTLFEVLLHVVGRFLPRLVFRDPSQRSTAERMAGILALQACDNLQVTYLWQGNKLSMTHTVFEGANIAARVGPSAESAFAKAMIGYLLAMAGLRGIAERDLRDAVRMADEAGGLQQCVSTKIYCGMSLSMFGRPAEGEPLLAEADSLVSRLGAGLWKHRGKYMLAESHLMLGHLDLAAHLFGASALIAISVEPPIAGFANAMRALCWIRQGRAEEGLRLIRGHQGLVLVRDNPIGLQLYNTLGALIEGTLWTGDWRAALQAAEEAVSIPEKGDEVNAFFTGYNGHAAVFRCFLTLSDWRQRGVPGSESLPSLDELSALALRARKNFVKAARIFPGAIAPFLVLDGWRRALRGDRWGASRTWTRVQRVATTAGMPYELGMACYEQGRMTLGTSRSMLLNRAREIFAIHGMVPYASRCNRPDQPLHPLKLD